MFAPLPRDQIPDRHFHQLRALDALVRTTRQSVVANPLWIAATHVEQSPQFLNASELLMKDPTLLNARAEYDNAERTFVKARRSKERFERWPRWAQAISNFILGSGEKVRTDFDKAANELLEAKTTVEQIMSAPIVTIEENKTLLDANDLMAQSHLRHLGVTRDSKLVGMISVRDLVVFLTNLPRK